MKGKWYPECEFNVTETTMAYHNHIVVTCEPHRIGPRPV